MIVRLAVGSWRLAVVRRGSRRADPAAEALLAKVVGKDGEAPDLLVNDTLRHPAAAGVARPTILLPARFLDEPEDRLRAALAHEWAHIRHGDLWLIAASRLLLPVLYAHPLFWWLRGRIRDDQEALADASAAGSEGRLSYAEALLSWSRTAAEKPWGAAGGSAALFERPSQIKRRIAMLLDDGFRIEPTCPARWRLAARALTITAVAAASLLTLRPTTIGAGVPAPQAPGEAEPGAGAVEARVLAPDGKPFAGARVFATPPPHGGSPAPIGQTGPDGSFRMPRADAEVVAAAEGFGLAFVDRATEGGRVLKLARDDVSIRGRVLDDHGRPVAGAVVKVAAIAWNSSGDLDRLIEGLRPRTAPPPTPETPTIDSPHTWAAGASEIPFLPPVVADRDGRFTLRGVGRERVATLRIAGEGIETASVRVATRETPTIAIPKVPDWENGPRDVYHGATFEYAARPGREVVGTVTDIDTGAPVAGAIVGLDPASLGPVQLVAIGSPADPFVSTSDLVHDDFRTSTDARGSYRLVGLPAAPRPSNGPGDGGELVAGGGEGMPHLPSGKPIGDGDPSKPVVVNIGLRRGVRVKGRVVDKQTGRGVRAVVSYFVLAGNPNMTREPRSRASRPGGAWTDDEGNFELIAYPGPGALAARVRGGRFVYDDEGMPYRRGAGLESMPGLKWRSVEQGIVDTLTDIFNPYDYQVVAGVDPKPGEAEVACELALDRGRTVKGRVVGPDGSPLAGALILGDRDYLLAGSGAPATSDEFLVEKLVPNAPRDVMAFHRERKLAGALKVAPDEPGPVVLKLEPHGQVIGRLVDAAGRPVAGFEIMRGSLWDTKQPVGVLVSGPVATDGNGRFHIEGLIPGRKYTFTVWKPDPSRKQGPPAKLVTLARDLVTASGETRDLGDVNHDGSE
ncbi:M56 family metallopeptidase [Planctomyces sp. SH-PL62]|uniref:M56 family metallopeptidase n=1 Tax=Planctomyces sp. SH-PL62 TaxID=1636152 RepID=UPI00078CF865|nr:M56 family metallopeptidase [Planctomyces sp. SH-PL62]AMV37910.1 BlaR1 peptidase M56 [Planctomyces sp. SH-PL62]